MKYAIWYDNSSGFFEAYLIVEAGNPEEAVAQGREKGLGSVDVVVTYATEEIGGFGNDPNVDSTKVLLKSSE